MDEYIDQQYQEYQQKHDGEEERLAELEAMREEVDEYLGYLDAWDVYQAEDDLDEMDEETAGDVDQVGWQEELDELDEEKPATDVQRASPTLVSVSETRVSVELTQLNKFAYSFVLHGEPLKLAENRNRLDRLLQQWQFSLFSFSAQEARLLQGLLHHRVFHSRKAHCFKCERHLYDHLDQTCLRCCKYQIICSDPTCEMCGCKHDPSFVRK